MIFSANSAVENQNLFLRFPFFAQRFYCAQKMQLEKIAVVGATGYSGEELIRLLLRHPGVDLACVTSRQYAGKALGAVYPKFRGGKYDALAFSPSGTVSIVASGARVVFLALPHGLAAEFAAPLL